MKSLAGTVVSVINKILTVAMALKQGVRFTDFAKLWWKLDKVNIRTFCYYDFFMLRLIAEI